MLAISFGRPGNEMKAKEVEEKEKVFVDLSSYPVKTKVSTDAHVKMVEVTSYSDLKVLVDMTYRGNVVVMDFSRFADGDAQKKEMVKDFLKVASDINGAFMEASDRIMILSGNGMPIDRTRLSHRS